MMDYKRLVKEANNKDIKVTLKFSETKGVGLFVTKTIKKGEVIAYYKVKIFKRKNYKSPTNNVYAFEVYKKNGEDYKRLVGDVYEDSFPPPGDDNITFWAPFANEPSQNQRVNAEIDTNIEENYENRKYSSEGEVMLYKLVATKMIRKGTEVLWFYGDNYNRDYKVGKK